MLFRIWLIWRDIFYKKWNSHYDENGLAGQFWQMGSAHGLKFWLLTFNDKVVCHTAPSRNITKPSPPSFLLVQILLFDAPESLQLYW